MYKKFMLSAAALLTIHINNIVAQTPAALPPVYTADAKINYIRTWEAMMPEQNASNFELRPVSEIHQNTTYYDGLGRQIQAVTKQASPLQKDLIISTIYDALGREQYKYLPYVSNVLQAGTSDNTGNFKINSFKQQAAFYNTQLTGQPGETNLTAGNLNYAYAQIDFELSPLSRVKKSFAPGASWVGSRGASAGTERAIQQQYLFNTPTDLVYMFTIGAAQKSLPVTVSTYGPGELFKNKTIDERGNQQIEFKDKEGKIILKKAQVAATVSDGHAGWLCTYYVYDYLGLLRYVIPPKATELFLSGTNILGYSDELCFRYEYDQRQRMIIKKVPGSGEVWMVYDSRDRLVMTQDANMRVNNNWLVVEYDLLNRPWRTGLLTDVNPLSYHMPLASASSAYPVITSGYEMLTQTFYDNYSWVTANTAILSVSLDVNAIANNFITSTNVAPLYAQPIAATYNTRGLITGTMIKVLNSSPAQYLYSVSFYDDHNRVIQTQSTNISGGKDMLTTQYDFSGKQLRTCFQHQKNGTNPQKHTVLTKYEYDHAGRILTIKKTINSVVNNIDIVSAEKTIEQNSYDELGRVKTKKIGRDPFAAQNPLEQFTYEYNVRNWLLGVNRDFIKNTSTNYFGFEVGYDKPQTILPGNSYTNPQYNGNIEGTTWKSKGDNEVRKYDFGYDNINRILSADFNQFTNGTFNKNAKLDFSIKMGDGINYHTAYDANGNILRMKHWGGFNNPKPIDDLTYNYTSNSNKLLNVIDARNDAATRLGDFRASALYLQSVPVKTISSIDYTYDLNGNLVNDQNKDIADVNRSAPNGIKYNHLNLPNSIAIKKSSGGTAGNMKGYISYVYDAAGNKLQKKVQEGLSPMIATTTTYINGLVYESKVSTPASPKDYTDVLQFIPHEGGRTRFKPAVGNVTADFVYDYFVKDHLGNVRMVLTEEQQTDIYPAATFEYTGSVPTILQATDPLTIESNYYKITNLNNVVASPLTLSPTYQNNNGNPPVNNNPNCNNTSPIKQTDISQKVYKLNGTSNRTDLGITLKVMAGDKIDILGKSYYYIQPGTSITTQPLTLLALDILNTLTSTIGYINSGKTANAETLDIYSGAPISDNFLTARNQPPQTPTVPKAFINYIFFDENFNYVRGGSSMVNNPTDAFPDGTVKTHNTDLQSKLAIKNGYVYVYCSNESQVNVFFDNLQVIHTRSRILEETHYYPFGLTMAGISSKAAGKLENKRKWNKGSELESKEFSDGSGLELYSTFYRSLDLQLGRFWQIDPKPDYRQSLYSSMNNNPISFNDVLGDTIINGQPHEAKDMKHATTLAEVTVVADKKPRSGLDGVKIVLYNPLEIKKGQKLGPGGLYLTSKNGQGQGTGTPSNGGDPQPVNIDLLMDAFGMVNRAGPLKKQDFSDPLDAVKLFGKITKQIGADATKVKEESTVIYSRESGVNFVVGPDGIGSPGSPDLQAADTLPKEKSPNFPHPIKN